MKAEILKIDGKNIQYVEEGVKELQEAEIEDYVKSDYVRIGTAELSVKDGMVTFCTMKSDLPKTQPASASKTSKPIKSTSNRNNLNIDKRFIVNIQGNDFITYNGLLEYAKSQGGGIQKKEIIEIITSEDRKSASVRVRITMKEGQIFEDVGTCTPENAKSVTSYPEELAVTRAYSRALRFGLVVDYCSQEELS